MQPAPIDPSLQNELKAGEQLLWWGKPDPAHSVKENNRLKNVMIIWRILAIILLALSLVCALLLRSEMAFPGTWAIASLASLEISTIVILLVTVTVFAFCLNRVYLQWKAQHKHATNVKNTLYGITNQRIIVMTATKQGLTVSSFTREDIGQINRIETGGGWGDIMFSKPRQIQRGTRSIAVVSKLGGIPNVRLVDDILTRTFKNVAPSAPPPPLQPTPQTPTQYPPAPEDYMQP
jgi:hypothetical protein